MRYLAIRDDDGTLRMLTGKRFALVLHGWRPAKLAVDVFGTTLGWMRRS